ncbi:MAG: ATP synthase F1 subunit epsilon [Lachnospiraceae bacterium]|nr:ATP synthase F1 subunit epsilon [Lachnospiraceae bacterium]
MKTFPLSIGTPDGLLFNDNVERIIVRSVTGDLAILADHINFVTALGMGESTVVLEDGTRKTAACIGGMLSVMDGACHVLATTWEWKEDIDVERAQNAKNHAEALLESKLEGKELRLAEAKLNRALVRLSVAK